MPFDPQPPCLLVVDDDPGLRDLLGAYLRDAGFEVETVEDGAAMRAALARGRHDLVVLDLMLPGEDGLSLCRSLRAHSALPVIMLTARGDEFDRVLGLEMGADDYLAKPFSPRELLARIKTVLRRTHAQAAPSGTRVRFGGWSLDLAAHRLTDPAGVAVPLSTGEFRLLRVLAEHLDRVLSRDRLIDALAGRDASRLDRSVTCRQPFAAPPARRRTRAAPDPDAAQRGLHARRRAGRIRLSGVRVRLLPRSLFGQVLLALLLGLLIAQGAALWLALGERARVADRLGGRIAAQRIGAVIELMEPVEPFVRLDPRARATRGAQASATIARAIARAHGGDVVIAERTAAARV